MNNANLAAALNEIVTQSSNSCVSRLAEKYGFDPVEAASYIASGGDVMLGNSSAKKSKSKSKAKGQAAAFGAAASDDTKSKPCAKRRHPTGYMLYCKAQRPTVAADKSLKPQEIISQLARNWKALEEDDRVGWQKQAKEAAEQSNSGSE